MWTIYLFADGGLCISFIAEDLWAESVNLRPVHPINKQPPDLFPAQTVSGIETVWACTNHLFRLN